MAKVSQQDVKVSGVVVIFKNTEELEKLREELAEQGKTVSVAVSVQHVKEYARVLRLRAEYEGKKMTVEESMQQAEQEFLIDPLGAGSRAREFYVKRPNNYDQLSRMQRLRIEAQRRIAGRMSVFQTKSYRDKRARLAN